jgi:hypothetical protein
MTSPGPADRSGSADRIAAVKRELLVRHLQAWAPSALHRGRRAVYAHGWADLDGGRAAEAALRVFTEQTDLVRGREMSMMALAADGTAVQQLLGQVQQDAGAAAGLVVHTVPGPTDERLAVALKAIGAVRVPLLGFLDASAADAPPARATVAALGVGKPAEVLLVLAPDVLSRLAAADADPAVGDRFFGGPGWRAVADVPSEQRRAWLVERYRVALHEVGFPLTAAVELVAADDAAGELVVLATTSGKSLEGFKEAMWAVDEYAGVRYRDPGDPEEHLIDISLTPHPGPLRRELLAHLAAVGSCTVTELRTFALTETVYRAADATGVIGALVTSGAVTREPEHGRLGGDVTIAPAGPPD